MPSRASRTSLPRLSVSAGSIQVLFCLSVALSLPVHAQTAEQEAARQADILQRQNQQRLQHDIESALPERAPGGIDTRELLPKVDASAAGKKCHDIRRIVIKGSPNLSDAVAEQVFKEYSWRCLGVAEIEQILGEITKDYISRGYVTTRAYLPQQDLSGGTLEIIVLEGVIEEITVDDGGRNSIRLGNAFPPAGELLNLRDFEQGIDQVNKLSSNDAQLDIQPGDKPGMSRVVIKNVPRAPLHLSLSADNQGSESTGKTQLGATLIGDRLLGLNELLLYTHRQSQPRDEERTFSSSDSFSFILPLRYSTLSISTSRSRYVSTLRAPSGLDLRTNGTSAADTYKLDRVMYRDQSTRFSMAGTLTIKESENYLAGELLGVSSRQLSVFDLDASVTTGVAGGILGVDVGYAKGLKFAGALHDPDYLPELAPRAQFGKIKAGLSYARPFRLGGVDMAFSTQVTGQRALDTLYGSEQILIGGIYSVRGFVKNVLSGDHGYYIRNELSARRNLALGDHRLPTRVYAGLDFGEVSNRVPDVPSGKLTGMAIGASVSWKGVSFDVFNARPLRFPSYFTREASQTWLRVNTAF